MGTRQETFSDFNIKFNALNENASFSSGDCMTGEISFVLSTITKLRSIEISLNGKAHVFWRTCTGSLRRRRIKNHSANKDVFNFRAVVLEENTAIGPTILQPGAHVYPFTCHLPEGNFPSTFHGIHGRVVYSLKVEIRRPWHLVKEFQVEFNYANHIDANQPKLLAPLSGSVGKMVCCLWCASGPVEMTVRIDRDGFVPGETITIMCEFSNASTRDATPTASLTQHQKYSTLTRSKKKIDLKTLDSVTGKPVKSGTLQAYSEMSLTIPDTSLSISNCSIIEVVYTVLVTLSIDWSTDISVTLPIVMCDLPVHTSPDTNVYQN
ncbi:arrestin domain-containing protein 3-like [Osmerus eperlanus]|uniref:arrestin domain-containing protein 3-like n=1 Tax=Osmerus eperlanus TaxID=29151 RepID=UPI002E15D092